MFRKIKYKYLKNKSLSGINGAIISTPMLIPLKNMGPKVPNLTYRYRFDKLGPQYEMSTPTQ